MIISFLLIFLSYINNGLETYRNREDVFSISAYNYPIKIPSHYDHNVYAWSGFLDGDMEFGKKNGEN